MMTEALQHKANALLYQVLDLPANQRQQHIATTCQSEPELRALVKLLLSRIDVLDQLVAAPLALFVRKAAPPAIGPRAGLPSGRSVNRHERGKEPGVPALPSAVVGQAGASQCLPLPDVLPDALLCPNCALARPLRGNPDQILMTTAAPDAGQRHPSADAIAPHLMRYAQNLPLDGAAPPPPRRSLRVCLAVGMLLFGLLLLGSAAMLWKTGESRFARVAAERRI